MYVCVSVFFVGYLLASKKKKQMIKQYVLSYCLLFITLCVNAQQADSVRIFKDVKSCLYGLKTDEGKIIVSPKFNYAHQQSGVIITTNNKMQTLYDAFGNQHFENSFSSIYPIKTNANSINIEDMIFNACVSINNKRTCGLLTSSGDTLLPFEYYKIDRFRDGRATVKNHKGKMGMVDTSGRIVVEPLYYGLHVEGNVIITDVIWPKRCHGLLDFNGNELIKPTVERSLRFNKYGLGLAYVKNKVGCVNSTGDIIIPWIFDDIFFSDSLVIATSNNKTVVYNKFGDTLARYGFKTLKQSISNIHKVELNGLYGKVNLHTGDTILSIIYKGFHSAKTNYEFLISDKEVSLFNRRTKKIEDDLSWLPYEPYDIYLEDRKETVFVNRDGKIVFELPVYAKGFKDSPFAMASEKSGDSFKYKLLNKTGKVVVPVGKYKHLFNLGKSHCFLRDFNQKNWLIDSTEKIIQLPPGNRLVAPKTAKNTLWIGSVSGKDSQEKSYYQLYDLKSHSFISEKVNSPKKFVNGLAIVSKNNVFGLMNTQGKMMTPFLYHAIERAAHELFFVQSETMKWGLIDKFGHVLNEPEWDVHSQFSSGYVVVEKGSQEALIDSLGAFVVPFSENGIVNSSLALSEFISFKKRHASFYDYKVDTLSANGNKYLVSRYPNMTIYIPLDQELHKSLINALYKEAMLKVSVKKTTETEFIYNAVSNRQDVAIENSHGNSTPYYYIYPTFSNKQGFSYRVKQVNCDQICMCNQLVKSYLKNSQGDFEKVVFSDFYQVQDSTCISSLNDKIIAKVEEENIILDCSDPTLIWKSAIANFSMAKEGYYFFPYDENLFCNESRQGFKPVPQSEGILILQEELNPQCLIK
jgi:hypothetical protein